MSLFQRPQWNVDENKGDRGIFFIVVGFTSYPVAQECCNLELIYQDAIFVAQVTVHIELSDPFWLGLVVFQQDRPDGCDLVIRDATMRKINEFYSYG